MSILEIRAGGRFKLKQKIGSGSFGDIYLAQNTQTGEEFAVKLEESNTKYPQLIYEAKIIHALQGGVGIPTLIWCGQEGDFNVLIMELLGDDIESLLNTCKRRFSLKTILILAEQIMTTLEYIHARGFLHRDLKPENLLMGNGKNSHVVHVIDYGLSKRYRDPKTGKHIPFREGKSLTGTARYASINTHQGKEQSRRDDLEALGYIMVYLFKGSLPWQGLPAPTKKGKYELIMQKKMETTVDVLCAGMPEEFKKYLEYCKNLKFEEKPDYHYLKRMFKELFIREGHENDSVYDWVLIPWSERITNEGDMNGKVMVNLEFSATDDAANFNLCNLQEYVVHTNHGKISPTNKVNVMPNQQQGGAIINLKDNDSNGAEKKKGAVPEYLRTELKSDNRKALVNNPSSPTKLKPVSSPKLKATQSMGNQKEKKGKDCNIF
jgi:serine/threonine protein kinase